MKKTSSKPFVKEKEGKLFIQTEYLYKHYPPNIPQEEEPPLQKTSIQLPEEASIHTSIQSIQTSIHPNTDELLKAKDQTISLLSRELEKKDEVIYNLTERQRESNIILQTLQERLKEIQAPKPKSQPAQKKTQKFDSWKIFVIVGLSAVFAVGLMIYLKLSTL